MTNKDSKEHGQTQKYRGARTARWVLGAGLALVFLAHAVWESLNDTPPVWDMAYHQLQGWKYLLAWWDGTFFIRFIELSPQYPPLYYLLEAFVLNWFSDTQYLALLSNLPGMILLGAGTYLVATRFLEPLWASAAGVTALLLPMVAWISRETLLDIMLAGWVTAAGLLLLRSRYLERPGMTVLFGLVSAAGMLTKWTFFLYLLGPLCYSIYRARDRKRALLWLGISAVVAAPLFLCYYGPVLWELLGRYPTTAQEGIIPWKPYPRHGEPGLNNLLGWIYYPRVFSSYFLFLPLSVLFVWGSCRALWIRNRQNGEKSQGFLWVWLIAGTVLLTLLTPKDPRFAVPLVTPLVILLYAAWKRSSWARPVIALLALFQFVAVSFSLPGAPRRLVLFERPGGDYQTLQQEWVLFQTHYFEVAGPPRVELWPYSEILSRVPEEAILGFLPELSRFHPDALRLQAMKEGKEISVRPLGNSPSWGRSLPELDFVISKDGSQGVGLITPFNEAVVEAVRSGGWVRVYSWPAPDGSEITLWKKPEE